MAWETKLVSAPRGLGAIHGDQFYLSLGDKIGGYSLKDGQQVLAFTAKGQTEFGNLQVREKMLVAHSPQALAVYELPTK